MARTTIPAELVAINAIQGTLIADNAITAVHIATNAVSGTLVADNAITSTHIAQNNVTATQIAMNTITVTQVADNAITTPKIIADAVTGAKIANDSIDSEHLVDGSIDTAHIGDVQVTAAKLGDNAVTLAKMASLARGSIIYGDSVGDPAALSIGLNGTVLKSDGTDVSWGAAGGTTINNNANNRIITGSGTANTLEGEANLIFDGTNLGIGQASDGDKLHVLGQGFFEDSRANGVGIQINGGSSSEFPHIGVSASNPLTFQTADTERMRIDGSGNLLIGTTSDTLSGTDAGFVFKADGNASFVTSTGVMYMRRTGSNSVHMKFRSTTNTSVGQISSDGSNTTYSTSSDYRLKENVIYDWDATARLKQLKPARFNFLQGNTETQDGFLAHEVQTIVPTAVEGIKDALDDNGNIDPQSIDHSQLVPLLVKTIQELEARITTLEG